MFALCIATMSDQFCHKICETVFVKWVQKLATLGGFDTLTCLFILIFVIFQKAGYEAFLRKNRPRELVLFASFEPFDTSVCLFLTIFALFKKFSFFERKYVQELVKVAILK